MFGKSSELVVSTSLMVSTEYTKYNVGHNSTHTYRGRKMKYLSEKMQSILERLSEMFPGSSYQSSLDAYLADKGITDAAQLENYIRQFNSQKERYL
jgi:hypothetical protein